MIENKSINKADFKELTIEEVFDIISNPLQKSFGICLVSLALLIVPCLIIDNKQEKDSYTTTICDLNTCFFPVKTYLGVCLTLVILIGVYLCVAAGRFKTPKKKFNALIFSSLVILFLLVYATGGLLDSPFTAAIVVYVSSYFIIQERDDLKSTNYFFLGFSILLSIAPYLLFSLFQGSCEHYIIRWKADFFTNIIRLFLTILLIILAGVSGDRINQDLTKALYEKNKIQN